MSATSSVSCGCSHRSICLSNRSVIELLQRVCIIFALLWFWVTWKWIVFLLMSFYTNWSYWPFISREFWNFVRYGWNICITNKVIHMYWHGWLVESEWCQFKNANNKHTNKNKPNWVHISFSNEIHSDVMWSRGRYIALAVLTERMACVRNGICLVSDDVHSCYSVKCPNFENIFFSSRQKIC